ncbi:hypothetical protein BTUL_0022g00340 [Botrytis tulipae]|uniref:Uncharacterized protein n=1 Tax=Botrytis tulipae TaxID=87230 RepID=A0A4Z1F2G3_9HELO|nr:hypothetical protein BTUL_0022g00340 [Botrytis tulipae]
MCIPCWPFTDVYLEEEKKKDNRSIMVFDPNTRQWVQIGGVGCSLFSFAAGLVIGTRVICQYKAEIHFISSVPASNLYLSDFANKNSTA